jgi:hypothetical protein
MKTSFQQSHLLASRIQSLDPREITIWMNRRENEIIKASIQAGVLVGLLPAKLNVIFFSR